MTTIESSKQGKKGQSINRTMVKTERKKGRFAAKRKKRGSLTLT